MPAKATKSNRLIIVASVSKLHTPEAIKSFATHSLLIGKRMNSLTAKKLGYYDYTNPSNGKNSKRWHYVCKCDCGKIVHPHVAKFSKGQAKSCGCQGKIAAANASTKHGLYRKTNTEETLVIGWLTCMWGRCYNPQNAAYSRYGGRGIKICKRWNIKKIGHAQAVKNFIHDMGHRPKGMTLDRKDNNRGYAKWNTRWATNHKQSQNRRHIRKISYMGESMTLAQWARKLDLSYDGLRARINRGWTVEKTLSTPIA